MFRTASLIITQASADKIDAAISSLGANASVREVLRAPEVDADVKASLTELMVFTSGVLGSDGARARLRHEQNGYALMFGASGAFLTPNLADTRCRFAPKKFWFSLCLHRQGSTEGRFLKLGQTY